MRHVIENICAGRGLKAPIPGTPEDQTSLPLFDEERARPIAFIAGYRQQKLDPEDPANLQAARIMADLYDSLTMPPALAKAHQPLDRAVDRCYCKESLDSDRVEFLFALYEKLTAPLLPGEKPKRAPRRKAYD